MNWLTIKNVHGEDGHREAEIWIDGLIGFKDFFDDSGVTSSEFIKTVTALGELEDLHVFINSKGGVVSDGVTITNYLINHKASISVTVMGQAASIASVVAQAADPGKLHMAIGTTMFVHDPLALAAGNADDMRKTADWLDKIRDSIVNFYLRRADLSDSDVRQLMKDETMMTAEEAVEWGFADSMDAQLKAVASVGDLQTVFNEARQAYRNKHQPPKDTGHNNSEGSEMDSKDITSAYIGEHHSEIATAFRDEGVETGKNEGATTERERIQNVLAQGENMPGHEELVNTLAFDGSTTGPEAAVQILQAVNKAREKIKNDINTDADKLNVINGSVDGDLENKSSFENMPLEEKAQAKWDASAELRTEFDDKFSTYLALEKGLAKGGKILGKTKK